MNEKHSTRGHIIGHFHPVLTYQLWEKKKIDISGQENSNHISILQMDKVHRGVTPGYVRTDVLSFK